MRTSIILSLLLLLSACNKNRQCDSVDDCDDCFSERYVCEVCDRLCTADTVPPPPTPEEEEDNCTSGEHEFARVLASININAFDNNPNSSYYGTAIATFTIKQDQYNVCENGQWEEYGYTENIISIKSNISQAVSFDYQLLQNADGQIREYQNVVTNLMAGETVDIETGDNTFYNVKMYPMTLTISTISYQ